MSNPFKIKRLSLRMRIFVSMILLTLVASVLIVVLTVYQFRNQAKEYHEERLEKQENAIQEHINYVLRTTTYPLTTENLTAIFKRSEERRVGKEYRSHNW